MTKRRSFRTTMIMMLGLSMLASGVVTFIVYKLLQMYYAGVRREDPLAEYRNMMRSIGDLYVFMLLFIPLAILFFYLFTRRYVTYFKEISAGINHLANGHFDHQVQIVAKDELGTIAESVNMASQKLREAVKRGDFAENSKDQLIVNLAHDLRTPLTSVLGYLDLLMKDEQLTEEQARHFIAIAFTKSQRLEKLIDDLFEITRMNYGMLPVRKTRLDLSELLKQMNEELYPVFEKNNLVTRLHIDNDLTVSGDGELLARVFENLLINAARHGKDGMYVDIKGFHDGGQVVIQVTNYGGHIHPDDLPHIFDMYYTGDRARTVQEGGTGLGLFIARNIVEQHEGIISAVSDVVHTMFEVRLPVFQQDSHET
ncbi:HAMP domain-containing sensor histidine kinase [Paenibacillus cucumis (ex Kampfer et al. 2016)]|uniref:histidine kinase n=1 Tax=Paenibacillus cucumis (ex Kampfer et al. 2016) TaxID=1776858 RepID=A0ABS7KRR7_9BACL|nr:HAMP domain-containing sensor histidine kinase [Paenibacillus cucumis (ex Kampfer et al. 2016)]MBY0206860.1 HAMP domain-containing histidine kinase [Paenibacillus cucumis (ex Kampfer et al. 2016)]